MSIQDDIAATDPWLYYPLDAGDAVDHGSNGHDAIASGSFDWTVAGIERGKTGLLLNATGALTSSNLGLTDNGDFTIACYAALPAQAAWNAWRALISIGRASSTSGVGGGGGLGLNGPSAGIPTASGESWPTLAFASGPSSTIAGHYWHHFAMVYRQSTNNVQCYLDGLGATAAAMSYARGAFIATDHVTISWPGQIVLTHVAFWRFALTGAQIAGIGGHAADFPFDIPIDQTGSGGGGGGGIPPDTQTQIDNIETNTNNIPGIVDAVNFISDTVNHIKGVTDDTNTKVGQIINDLLPQLANVLNDIGSQVTQILGGIMSKVKTAGGDVAATVGQLLEQHSHDVFGLDNMTGGPTCDPVDINIGNTLTWGIIIHITTRPPMYTPMTPDHDYTKADLAVVTIKRAEFELLRVPVHGTYEHIGPLPETFPAAIADIGVPLIPANYHIIVEWGFGVCGEVLREFIP